MKYLKKYENLVNVGAYVIITSDYHELYLEPAQITAEVDEDIFECMVFSSSQYYEISPNEIDRHMTEEEIELHKATKKYNL